MFSALDLGKGFIGGLLAGLIGGVGGEFLFQSLGGDAGFMEIASRVLGWSLFGALIGGGMQYVASLFE